MSSKYAESCELIAAALGERRAIVDHLVAAADPSAALRSAMKRNVFETASGKVSLQSIVSSLDSRSRKEGLHLVQAWDFGKQVFSDDSIPVLLLDYCSRLSGRKADARSAVAVLLDQYFVTVVSLLAVRAWDEGDANANLGRVSGLLLRLQGEEGSGYAFIDDAESLLFLSISYFHPDEIAYDVLLARVEQLDAAHQLRVATTCAGMMSAHLRWGLRFMYQRDVGRMRDDNVADYPWLSHAVATLAREYDRSGEGVDALVAGLAADPWAFTGEAPAVLAGRTADTKAIAAVLGSRKTGLLDALSAMQAAKDAFSPLSFTCNFPTNAAVAATSVALEDGRPTPSVNALFRRGDRSASEFAERLMKFSASHPGRLGAGGAPLLVHDPLDGASAANALARCLR
jgi:hypothetical protein